MATTGPEITPPPAQPEKGGLYLDENQYKFIDKLIELRLRDLSPKASGNELHALGKEIWNDIEKRSEKWGTPVNLYDLKESLRERYQNKSRLSGMVDYLNSGGLTNKKMEELSTEREIAKELQKEEERKREEFRKPLM